MKNHEKDKRVEQTPEQRNPGLAKAVYQELEGIDLDLVVQDFCFYLEHNLLKSYAVAFPVETITKTARAGAKSHLRQLGFEVKDNCTDETLLKLAKAVYGDPVIPGQEQQQQPNPVAITEADMKLLHSFGVKW